MNDRYLHPHPSPEEGQKLEPERQNFSDRIRHASEQPATSARKDSLLRTLAEEALGKGNPVLVIPMDSSRDSSRDTSTSSGQEEAAEQEPHDLRLPKNTTVIFTAESGFPVTAITGGPKVREVSGDLGTEAAKREAARGRTESAQHICVFDPFDSGTVAYSPLFVDQDSSAPEESR